MPKNQFQRPQAVARNHNVPRHGAPLPLKKPDARKVSQARPEAVPLLPLESLLKPTRH